MKTRCTVLLLPLLNCLLSGEGFCAETSSPDKAWTNSLGMAFVPVPGTEVWFCIWEIRVQDYQAFLEAETIWGQAPLKKPRFEQGPLHPMVNVSWEDAKTFCMWLTAKEQVTGLLKNKEMYRLPTDLEWSRAVGLPEEAGKTAQQRSYKTPGYPWGKEFPPPNGAGNYAPSLKVDNFRYTAPVGSFKPNDLGIYDLGGNVWEWCMDMDDGRNRHVLRGASWHDGSSANAAAVMSSRRDYTTPDGDIGNYGFRCVLIKSP